MSKSTSPLDGPDGANSWARRILESRILGHIINFPPVAWLVRTIVRLAFARRRKPAVISEATIERAAAVGLEATLQSIVQDVVDVLGYAGAMVATYEHGDSLPARAIYVDPRLATLEDIHDWEQRIAEVAGYPVSITDPDVARVYVYRESYSENLSVRAAKAGGPVTSDSLYDLFVPIAPLASRPLVSGIQQALGIQQVIAVPFFLEAPDDEGAVKEMVGNLFAAKRTRISEHDILVLSAFGRQAAAAIGSERRRLQITIAQELTFRVQTSFNDEAAILQWIVRGVVSDLGYVGAMVAPYEPDGALPSLALYVDPSFATEEDIHKWEQQISEIADAEVSIFDPDIARVYVNHEAYKDNLSVRAAKAGQPVTSRHLYDLFTPVVPSSAKGVVRDVQRALGIQQVIAVPFFLETFDEGKVTLELVGNLFAATRSQSFKRSEIELLRAFGQQAAAGIRNARLYRKSEERRQTAQVFAKMAFSAATAVHALRNHIGIVRLHVGLLDTLPDDKLDVQLQKNPLILERLDTVTDILDTLGEPWRQISDAVVDVNECLQLAIDKIVPLPDRQGVDVNITLAETSLHVKTSSDMLTETFRVLIKNAVEAIRDRATRGHLDIVSRQCRDSRIQISICDNGIGIPPENINKIFEIGWTTKRAGMGFGLFWAKDYVEGLGGTITVDSVVGEGTTFFISLPCADSG